MIKFCSGGMKLAGLQWALTSYLTVSLAVSQSLWLCVIADTLFSRPTRTHIQQLVGSCVGHLFGEITYLFSKAGLGYSFAFGNTTMGFRQSHLPTSFHFLLLIAAHYTWQYDNDRQGNYFNIISLPLTYTSLFFNQISEV